MNPYCDSVHLFVCSSSSVQLLTYFKYFNGYRKLYPPCTLPIELLYHTQLHSTVHLHVSLSLSSSLSLSPLPPSLPPSLPPPLSGYPIFAWRGQSDEDFWWCIDMCLYTEHWTPTMILDDGGDATHRLLTKFPSLANGMEGIVEESVTGIHRLYQLSKEGQLPMPAINIHDSVVKVSEMGNFTACTLTF